jgi:hypothetical protein
VPGWGPGMNTQFFASHPDQYFRHYKISHGIIAGKMMINIIPILFELDFTTIPWTKIAAQSLFWSNGFSIS